MFNKKEYYLKKRSDPKYLITKIYSHQKQTSKRRKQDVEYSKDCLSKFLLENKTFLRLFNLWVESGFKKELIPSVDRINNNLGYTLDNIQIITWKENNLKGISERRKPIYQINILDNSILSEYDSTVQASLETGISKENIHSVLKSKTRTAGGYKWKYAGV